MHNSKSGVSASIVELAVGVTLMISSAVLPARIVLRATTDGSSPSTPVRRGLVIHRRSSLEAGSYGEATATASSQSSAREQLGYVPQLSIARVDANDVADRAVGRADDRDAATGSKSLAVASVQDGVSAGSSEAASQAPASQQVASQQVAATVVAQRVAKGSVTREAAREVIARHFQPSDVDEAATIAYCESRYVPTATRGEYTTEGYAVMQGWFQISSIHNNSPWLLAIVRPYLDHMTVSEALMIPDVNAEVAAVMASRRPWFLDWLDTRYGC